MGIPLIDYLFKSKPFEFNYRLLAVNGFWPVYTKNRFIQVVFSAFGFLCCFSPYSMFFIQILDLYLLRNDPLTLTKNMCAFSITFACVVKHILVFNKVDETIALHRKLTAFKESRSAPEDLAILRAAERFMARTTKAAYSLAIPCITAWMLYPGLEAKDQKSVPFPYRLPTEDWSTPIYEILYTYQSLSMVGFMVMVLSVDLIYYGMVVQINAQYDMLMARLGSVNPRSGVDEGGEGRVEGESAKEVSVAVSECVVFHQDIIKEVDELKNIFSMPYLVHFASAITLVGVIIIDMVMVSKAFKLQMLQRIMYAANGIFDTFLCCFFTTLLQEKSYDLMRAVYSIEWYRLGPQVRRDLIIILMRSKKAPTIRVGKHFTLNLATFLQFLKLSYNAVALLYQTVKNKSSQRLPFNYQTLIKYV